MSQSVRAASGRIFLSYRREETAYAAGWLYDRLAEYFGGDQVFKDIDSIELGDDFIEAVTNAVESCDVLLALIGDRWLTVTGADGGRRLEDPRDFVRLEIEAALTRGVRVVPILVAGARMPEASDLPPSLARLVRRQALELSPSRFDSDLSRLLRVLGSTLADARGEARRQTGPRRPATGATIPPVGLPVEGPTSRQATWYHRCIRYRRFWFGLVIILAGWIPFLVGAPHYYGFEKYPSVAHLHEYIELGLGVLILLGVLLLLNAVIFACWSPSTSRNQP